MNFGALVGTGLLILSWITAAITAGFTEYAGWYEVFRNDNVPKGLAIAFLLAPFVFMTVQTIIGGLAGLIIEMSTRTLDPPESDY